MKSPPDSSQRQLKFQELADELRRGISAGVWPLGGKLPTEDQLSAQSGLSLTTVRRALDELVSQGLIVRRQGAGSFVTACMDREPPSGRRVGVLIPDLDFYFPRILQGIEVTLSAAGVGIGLATYNYDQTQEDAGISRLIETGVEGLILTPTVLPPVDAAVRIAELEALPHPVVLLERSFDMLGSGDRTEYVCSDRAGGAYDAVRHLHRLGHRHIALLQRQELPTGSSLADGYHRAIRDLGLEPTIATAKRTQWQADAGESMLNLVCQTECTAALVFGDQEATLLERAAMAREMRLPDDLALISYDDELADQADVQLTAVSPPKHRLGVLAAQIMLRRLAEGEACPLHQIRLRPRLVIRQSCGARRSTDPAGRATVASLTGTLSQTIRPTGRHDHVPGITH